MLIKTDVLVRGFPIWIQLEHPQIQKDPQFQKAIVSTILKDLIDAHMGQLDSSPNVILIDLVEALSRQEEGHRNCIIGEPNPCGDCQKQIDVNKAIQRAQKELRRPR